MKQSLRCILALLACLTLSTHAAEPVNLAKNGDAETGGTNNWQNWTEVVSEGAHGGQHAFLVAGSVTIRSAELIPVDPEKTYLLTGWFKSTGPESSKIFFGYIPLDAGQQQIQPCHVNAQKETETTLVEPCTAADKILKVADASTWVDKQVHLAHVAFQVDASGECRDLPNRNVTKSRVKGVERVGDAWEVTLQQNCGLAYPAGTPVRIQTVGSGYVYNAAGNKKVPAEWKQFQGRITGLAMSGSPGRQWWPGTKFAQIVILANYGQSEEFSLLVDDISMVEQVAEP